MKIEGRRRRNGKHRTPNMEDWSEEQKKAYANAKALETPIAEMKLSVRTVNTLEGNNILLCKDLIKQSLETLLVMRNFGGTALREAKEAIKLLGLEPPTSWKMPVAPKKRNKLKGDQDILKWL